MRFTRPGHRTGRLAGVSVLSWVSLTVIVVAAPANWWSRWVGHRPTELWSKPLALVGLIGVAVALDPADPVVRAWFVAALVLSLAGDVFLLGGDRWFIAGLASFLAGHLAYTAGFVAADPWRWWAAGLAAVAAVAMAATVGRRIVVAAGDRSGSLRGPVAAYLGIISLMLVAAAAAGNGWAVVGAGLFVVSDAVLGWAKFVRPSRWAPLTIMMTYHLAQIALVVSLL